MRILTISASPYVLTRLGRLHASIISFLVDAGHDVSSAVWHHNKSYYMPDESDKKCYFEKDGRNIAELFLINAEGNKSVVDAYEVIKKVKPDLVISIGDYYEVSFISPIKALSPTLFRWISILTTAGDSIEPSYRESLDYMDLILVSTQDGLSYVKKTTPTPASWCPVGFDGDAFFSSEQPDLFRVMANIKNSQSCNLPAFLIGSAQFMSRVHNEAEIYLHTNVDESGDYRLRDLIENCNVEVILPRNVVTIHYGISDEDLRQEYSKSTVIVDPSMKSATAMCLLEGMACGCTPLAARTCASKDVLSDWNDYFIDSVSFVGERHQKLEVVDSGSLAEKLEQMYYCFKERKDKGEDRSKYICKAREFRRKFFLEKLKDAIDKVMEGKEAELAVEVLV